MATMVSRDGFARAGLARECHSNGECSWCGNKPKRTYTYTVETDGGSRPILGQPIGAGRTFCNLDCFRSYSS